MQYRRRVAFFLAGAAAIAAIITAVYRHAASGRRVPGGMLIDDPRGYDRLSHRILLGSFFGRIAADIEANAAHGARVLEVGCGPGHLSIRMASQLDYHVTGLDLDPRMIEVARANADHQIRRRPPPANVRCRRRRLVALP